MSENKTNKEPKNEEIDLMELFRRIGNGIKNLYLAISRGILFTFFYFLKRWLPIVISLFLGLGASYLMKETSDSIYTSDLILRANVMSNSDMIAYINRLHTYSLEHNSQALTEATGLSPVQIDNIIDISAFWIIDKGKDGYEDYVDFRNSHNVYDTINVRMQDRFEVRVKIMVPSELSIVRDGIIRYFNSDTLFQIRNRVRLSQNRSMLSRLNYDIEQLDSLQKIKYFEETKNRLPQNGGQMVFLQEQKTQLVYDDIYKLYAKKQTLELEQALYKEIITVVSDFSSPARRTNGISFYSKTVVPFFIIMTLIIIAIWENRKKIIEVSKRY